MSQQLMYTFKEETKTIKNQFPTAQELRDIEVQQNKLHENNFQEYCNDNIAYILRKHAATENSSYLFFEDFDDTIRELNIHVDEDFIIKFFEDKGFNVTLEEGDLTIEWKETK